LRLSIVRRAFTFDRLAPDAFARQQYAAALAGRPEVVASVHVGLLTKGMTDHRRHAARSSAPGPALAHGLRGF
jgi:hypothetical protein